MNQVDKDIVIKRYVDRLHQFGPNIKALASGNEYRQKIRFKVLKELGVKSGETVLDVGCGLGDFNHYLSINNVNAIYTGIDIVPELIEAAKKKDSISRYEVRDIQLTPYQNDSFDYIVCSQVFNLKLINSSNLELVFSMLQLFSKISKKGVAVDFLTSYVDYKEDHLHYYSPEEIFRYIKENITKNVTLRHDYPLFEFCIYFGKDFKGWNV